MPAEPPPLTTAEVAHLLGVKPATVYAYVSRGLLGRRRNADGKNSLFDRREVDAFLAARKHPTTPGIQTGITLIQDGFLYYRGHDAVQLARVASFEEVVALLWTGVREYVDLAPDPGLRDLAGAVIAPLPASARHTDRLRVIVAAAAAGDPLRFDTTPTAVTATGRAVLGTMVAALPTATRAGIDHIPGALEQGRAGQNGAGQNGAGQDGAGRDGTAGSEGRMNAPGADDGRAATETAVGGGRKQAEGGRTPAQPVKEHTHQQPADTDPGRPARQNREGTRQQEAGTAGERVAGARGGRLSEMLWGRLTDWEAAPREHNLLDAALILLADHDIAASTLAARVAASTWAHPYAVVGAGLAALDGPLHGAASSLAHPLLAEVMARPDPVEAIAGRLRSGEAVPGFGHRLYPDGDPRAVALLDMLGDTRARDAAERLAEVMRARSGVRPNVDLALAALTLEYGMAADAGETIFAVARTAGWIAHALEEYSDRPSRFRPSGEYTGQTIGSGHVD